MKTSEWIRALAATAMLLSACGTGPASVIGGVSPTPSAATQAPTASPAPTRNLALVTVRGSNNIVVRDLTDINHPRTISNLGPAAGGPEFVSATELSAELSGGLVRMPLSGSPKTPVAGMADKPFFPAWNPDGSAIVYMTESSAGQDVHRLSAGVDQDMGSIPATGGGGCESFASCTIPNWLDYRLTYSPDGSVISLIVNGFGASTFRLWTSSGVLLASNDSKGLTMSTWSGHSLYFRDANTVQVWQDGATSSFLPAVTWINPKASPGGGQIVYAARDSAGWAHVFVVDTNTHKVRELRKARVDPVFLTPRFVWYQGERACTTAERCGAHPAIHPLSGKTYIYDLQTGTETESIITSVVDVWPHPA